MDIIDMSEIDKRKRERNRKEIKDNVSEDMVEVFEKISEGVGDYFKRKRIKKGMNQPRPTLFGKLLKLIWWLSLLILFLNIFLGNIWLLRIIIKSLFNI